MLARVSKRPQVLPNKNMVARVSKRFPILPDRGMMVERGVPTRNPQLPNINMVARVSKKASNSTSKTYIIPNKNLIARVSKRFNPLRSFPQLGTYDHLEEPVYPYNPIDEILRYVRTYIIFEEDKNRVLTGNNVANTKLIM